MTLESYAEVMAKHLGVNRSRVTAEQPLTGVVEVVVDADEVPDGSIISACNDLASAGGRVVWRRRFHENVGEDVRALVRRGNVTLKEWQALQCNSWEWEALVPALDAEAFEHYARHVLKESGLSGPRPCVSYREALALVVVPELLRRLKEARARAEHENAKAVDALGRAGALELRLADVQRMQAAMHRRAQRMEGADARLARVREGYGRYIAWLHEWAADQRRGARTRFRVILDALRAAGFDSRDVNGNFKSVAERVMALVQDRAAWKKRAEDAERQLDLIDQINEDDWEDGNAASIVCHIRSGLPLDGIVTQEQLEEASCGDGEKPRTDLSVMFAAAVKVT